MRRMGMGSYVNYGHLLRHRRQEHINVHVHSANGADLDDTLLVSYGELSAPEQAPKAPVLNSEYFDGYWSPLIKGRGSQKQH